MVVFSLTELGNRLKEAREAKGLSLDDLQSITKIQKRYLKGIEEGNYSMMPGKFYVRAFIKQYAEAVDLEMAELSSYYKEEIPSVLEEQPEQLSRVQTNKPISTGNSKLMELFPKVLIGIFIIGAFVLLYYFFLQKEPTDNTQQQTPEDNQIVNIEESADFNKEAEKEQQEKEKEKKAADEKKGEGDKEKEAEKPEDKVTQEIAVVSAQGRQTTFELKNTDKFELKIVTTGETWINVKNGKGTSFFSGMLKLGATESQTFDFSKETEAIIVVGKSTETQIFVNGQKVEFAVPPADQVRQDITIRYVLPSE